METALAILREVKAEAEAEAEGGCEVEVSEISPDLGSLLEMPTDGAARAFLQALRRLLCQSSLPPAANAAERRMAAWAWEWLDMRRSAREELVRHLVRGLALLPPAVQARHLALLVEARLAAVQDSSGFELLTRHRRGFRLGRVAFACCAALGSEELDHLGRAAADDLSSCFTPLGMARSVVHLSAFRRRQLSDLLVLEGVLAPETSRRMFHAMSCAIAVLGADGLEATLWGVEGTFRAGSSVVAVGSGVVDAIGQLGSTALRTAGSIGAESLDILNAVRTTGLQACMELLPLPDQPPQAINGVGDTAGDIAEDTSQSLEQVPGSTTEDAGEREHQSQPGAPRSPADFF